MVDQCVRLGMAIVVIGLISVGLHQFSGHASVVEPGTPVITARP
jgi:molybdopterin/thiamine biosynthesis adenylyltransferase